MEDFRSSESGVAQRRAAGVDALGQVQLDIARQELARQKTAAGSSGLGSQFNAASPVLSGNAPTFNSVPAGVDPNASLAARRGMSSLMAQQTALGQTRNDLQSEYQTLQGEYNMALRANDPQQAQDLQERMKSLQTKINTADLETGSLNAQAANFVTSLGAPSVDPDLLMMSDAIEVNGQMVLPDDGKFRQGDQLELIVREDPSLNGSFTVRHSGLIHPDVGRVEIIGMNHSEAEMAIKATLESTMLRTASVTVERIPIPRTVRMPKRAPVQTQGQYIPPQKMERDIVYLAGEFLTPGPLLIPPGVKPTLLQTIIRSGGITPSGDMMRVKLLRVFEGKGSVEEVNVAAILSGQEPPVDIELEDGDIVVIPPFAPVVYVTGNVERPGTLRLFQDETLTAYAAILRAGGFARFAALTRVYVVRDLGNGEKAHLPINIKDVQKGLEPDVVLQGKDIVVVPERFFSF